MTEGSEICPLYEIFHVCMGDFEWYKANGDTEDEQKFVGNVQNLLDNGENVVFNEDLYDLPAIDINTPIEVGGGDWGMCVRWRAFRLQQAGFTHVKPNYGISLDTSAIVREKYERIHGKTDSSGIRQIKSR